MRNNIDKLATHKGCFYIDGGSIVRERLKDISKIGGGIYVKCEQHMWQYELGLMLFFFHKDSDCIHFCFYLKLQKCFSSL